MGQAGRASPRACAWTPRRPENCIGTAAWMPKNTLSVTSMYDELFVDEYEPARHAAADISAEKRAARMGRGCLRARCGRDARGCGHPT